MGWVWKDEDDEANSPSVNRSDDYSNEEDRCSTRKIVKSKCRTVEVEPGNFIRKCEKTEQIIKECLGRPAEVVQSKKEYTEYDITEEVMNGSFSSKSSELAPFNFPGLRDDVEAIERELFGGLGRFLDAAEEMKNDFFNAIGSPNLRDREPSSSSSTTRWDIPIEDHTEKKTYRSDNSDSGDFDLAGWARDV